LEPAGERRWPLPTRRSANKTMKTPRLITNLTQAEEIDEFGGTESALGPFFMLEQFVST